LQVFVPLPDIGESVRSLDDKRLFKQLLECVQLLAVILNVPKDDGTPRTGWKNHPAALQWKLWPGALRAYALAAAEECRRRGLNSAALEARLNRLPCEPSLEMPVWWGDERVHSSHRARLLQKDFDHYSRFGWPEASDPMLADRQYEWAIPSEDGKSYTLEHRGG
jgi:hypothetical protein